MKANELRIGNIIKDDRKSKEWRFVTHRIISDLASNPGVDLYHAVDLTEEWLLKFGYFELEYTDDEFRIFDFDYVSKVKLFKDGRFEYCPLDPYSFSIPVKYVHKLQNAFFEIEGRELTIKE